MFMAFTEGERTDIRRFCGYPAYGAGNSGFQGWRFYQAYGLLEYRIQYLTGSEEEAVRQYLGTLSELEAGVTQAAANLDTSEASVWRRNPNEVRDRTRLLDDWRRRLCGFLGVPPGPALGDGGVLLVV
jgi:hypothetical protein